MKNLSKQVFDEFARHQAMVSADDQELLETDELVGSVDEFRTHEEALDLATMDDGMEYSEAFSLLERNVTTPLIEEQMLFIPER